MITYLKIFRVEPGSPKPTVRGLKLEGKTEFKRIWIKTWIEKVTRKIVYLVNNGAKHDRMEKRAGSSRLVGNDEHISRHPHQGVLEKISLVMETFKKEKDQRIREPAWHRQEADKFEQRDEEDQGFQEGGKDDGVDGFAGT